MGKTLKCPWCKQPTTDASGVDTERDNTDEIVCDHCGGIILVEYTDSAMRVHKPDADYIPSEREL